MENILPDVGGSKNKSCWMYQLGKFFVWLFWLTTGNAFLRTEARKNCNKTVKNPYKWLKF